MSPARRRAAAAGGPRTRRSAAGAPRPPAPDELHLKRQRDMTLATRGRRSGKEHRVVVWFVHEAGRLYLMTYARRHGRGTDWFQNLRRAGNATIEVGDRRYRGHWEDIDDPAGALERITDMFSAKYGRQMVASYYLETKRFPVILRLSPLP